MPVADKKIKEKLKHEDLFDTYRTGKLLKRKGEFLHRQLNTQF